MLYVPLDFKKGLSYDARVEIGAYVSAIAQIQLDRIKQQAPAIVFKIDDLLTFEKWTVRKTVSHSHTHLSMVLETIPLQNTLCYWRIYHGQL